MPPILGPEYYRHLTRQGSEDELLLEFCELGVLVGRYIPQFRVGKTIADRLWRTDANNSTLFPIDAVCDLHEPLDYELVGFGSEGASRITKSRKGRLARPEWEPPEDGRVALIEVKSGKLDHESIGQLMVYRKLFQLDFPDCLVAELWIVAREDDPLIRRACAELKITVWTKA